VKPLATDPHLPEVLGYAWRNRRIRHFLISSGKEKIAVNFQGISFSITAPPSVRGKSVLPDEYLELPKDAQGRNSWDQGMEMLQKRYYNHRLYR
jgi:hypothetical protein